MSWNALADLKVWTKQAVDDVEYWKLERHRSLVFHDLERGRKLDMALVETMYRCKTAECTIEFTMFP